MLDGIKLRLMTYNIGGGKKDLGKDMVKILTVIKTSFPDIIAIQEAVDWQDLDGELSSASAMIAKSLDYDFSYFGSTLSMREHFHINKSLFAYWIFNDIEDWWQGNALISRHPFLRLGDVSKRGTPRNFPIYRKLKYYGYRDSESRYVLLGRIDLGSIKPIVITTHLSTIIGERGGEMREIPGKTIEAQKIRLEESQHIIDLINEFLLKKGELVFLMGDFNANETDPSISNILKEQGGFHRLLPQNEISTHPKIQAPVDHIFVHPGNTRIEYKCWIVDDNFDASDHNPVVADIIIYNEQSKRFQEFGPGVERLDL